jgi:nanoRNase/pAp phosphatase (c-di-AMP/oligoRNAs hydrolase)
MIARGAPHLEIAAALHKSMTRQHLNFQSWVISNAVPVGDALVLTADRRSRLRFGVGTNDAKIAFGPTSQLLDVNLVALLIERDDGQTFLSFRSPGSDRAQALARRFGGGGHPSAAGARVDRSLWDVQSELIALLSVAEVA